MNIGDSQKDEKVAFNPLIICSCGRPLMPLLNKDGKRIGVTHTWEDDDWHWQYWSTEKVMERIKSN